MKHLSRFLLMLALVMTGTMTAYAQSKLSGQVTDETGEPLPGVTIIQKGTTNGVATNVDGRYTIILTGNKPVIVARYVGYASAEHQVQPGQSVLNIQLTQESNAMNELVVVGYGQQKKVNLTGAVDQVTSEVFDGRPSANVAQMLEGVVPNLNISLSDGRPIRSSDFNIRGTGSINGGSALVLIDGVEGDPSLLNPADIASVSVLKDAASAAIYGARAPFGVVLITTKNPNAGKAKVQYQSIYSLQSPQNTPQLVSDGYIFAKHFYDAWDGFYHTVPSSINKTQEFSMDWLKEYEERHAAGNFGTVISDGSIGTKGRYVYYNDKLDSFDLLYKDNTFATTQNLSISGSDNKFDYYISGRFYHYDGLFDSDTQTDKLNTYNLRFKAGYQATSWFKINNNFEFSYSRYKMPRTYNEVNGNVWRNIIGEGHPSSPLLNPDGTQTYSGVYSLADFLYGDSYELTTKHQFKNTTSFVAKFFKNRLTIQGDLTFRRRTIGELTHLVRSPYARSTKADGSSLIETISGVQSQLGDRNTTADYFATNIYATWAQTFNKKHDVKILAGWNYERAQSKVINTTNDELLTNDVTNIQLAFGTDNKTIASSWGAYRFGGAFFRANYAYDNRYLLEVNGRYDGSSRFPSDRRYNFFPSVSLGWRLTEEKFWHVDPALVSNIKVRASYGQLGNASGLSNYQYIQTLSRSTSSLIFNGVKRYYVSSPAALPESLSWEKATTYDIGADLSFLNRRLSISGDYYQRKTKDMIVAGPTVPDVFGASSPKGNYADLSTYGYELSVEWQDQFKLAGKPFRYSIRATLADYYSTIDKYNNATKSLGTQNDQAANGKYYTGMRIGEMWGYKTDGFWQTQEEIDEATLKAKNAGQKYYNPLMKTSSTYALYPGDVKILDLNGNGFIDRGKNTVDDPGDRCIIGNSEPRYIYSFRLSAEWNGIWASAFFQGVGKQDWYPSSDAGLFWGQYNRPYGQMPAWHLNNYWTKDTPNAYLPRYAGNNYLMYKGSECGNDRYIQNVAYLALKNVQVGYNLPKRWIAKAHIQELGIYFSGENLYTWSPLYKHTKDLNVKSIYGADVDLSTSGDGYNYPMMKSYSLGINITF